MSPVAQPSDSVSLTNNSDHSSQNPGVLHGRILEKGDRVRHTFRIGRVTGLDAYEGPDYIIFCDILDLLSAAKTPNPHPRDWDFSGILIGDFSASKIPNPHPRHW